MAADSQASGPVLQLLASALQLWVRQQCQAVQSLDIQLEGSALGLLRGRLQGVRLQATQVVYQGLQLERAELRSGAIAVQLGHLWRGQPLELDQAFTVRGLVGFTASGLSQSLGRPEWLPLAESLGEQLLEGQRVTAFRTEAAHLVLSAAAADGGRPVECRTTIGADGGTIAIRRLDGAAVVHLPMDPAIRIERASLEGELIVLEGEALVSP
ncbi:MULTISPECIES: LmeA family phospholipid-binding protein [Aphanothece]|uniref:LmeA family phospholipid-binding protein n=1 Tax=Aphanothece TaxID=1121 RepID=UPI003984C493